MMLDVDATAGVRRYRIPATRLPFVNGEMAEVDFGGTRRLVSAAWCGEEARGRVYFFDPEAGESDMRLLPEGIAGAYMLKTAADGRLYLGCGNGDLLRYDPAADGFERLVTGAMKSITWGGCVTGRHVVWAASPGEAAVYDIAEGRLVTVFSPLDTETPTALYGHTVLAAPDGRAVVFVNVPQTRIVVVDPVAGMAASHTPAEMLGAAWTTQAAFVDGGLMVALVSADPAGALVIEYPSLRVVARVAAPELPMPTNQRACVIGGKLYAWFGAGGSLYRFDASRLTWELMVKDWLCGETAYLGVWRGKSVAALGSDGVVRCWNSESGRTAERQIDAWGPLEAHAFCVVERDVIVGAPFINRRFWRIELSSGEGRDLGRAQPGSGQINQIVWDDVRKKVLMSAYTSAALTEYDPALGGEWPVNPRLVGMAKDQGQMRPRGLAFDGRFAWMVTSPQYGKLGGALVRFDPRTDETRVWRDIVPGQTMTGVVLETGRGRLYASSEIYADCGSCPPTATTGQVVVFDMRKLEVLRRREMRAGDAALQVMCLLSPGCVLVRGEKAMYRWDAERDVVEELGAGPAGLEHVVVDDGGRLWAVASGGIGRLSVVDGVAQFEFVIAERRRIRSLQIVGETMYYPAGVEVMAVPMAGLGALPRTTTT